MIFLISAFLRIRTLITVRYNEFSADGIPNDSLGGLYLMRLSESYAQNQTFIITAISSTSAILKSENPIIIYDYGPCFWIAEGSQLGGRTGGEAIWCKSLIGQLTDMGRSVYVTNSSMVAKKLSYISHIRKKNVIIVSHWGWQGIAKSSWDIFTPQGIRTRIPVDSIGKDCLIKMNFWGTNVPTEMWPGSLRRYLTIYPTEHSSESINRNESNMFLKTDINKSYNDNKHRINYNTASGLGDQFLKCASDSGHYKNAKILWDNYNNNSGNNSRNISAMDMKILNMIINSNNFDGILNNNHDKNNNQYDHIAKKKFHLFHGSNKNDSQKIKIYHGKYKNRKNA